MDSLLYNGQPQEDLETPVTLLGVMDNSPEVMGNSLEVTDEDKKASAIDARMKFFMNPNTQAEILMQNYLMSHPEMILTGQQKRSLRREFLKNAKKGKYRSIFEKQANNIPSGGTFGNLNA